MRVSNKLMADTITTNLARQAKQMAKSQTSIATGKRINTASDDPIGMGKVLEYRNTISSMDQYQRNIENAQLRLKLAESVLGTVDSLLSQAKEIASDTSVENRAIWSTETENIRNQIIELANTKLNGHTIFSGHQTDADAFDAAGVYQGDAGKKNYTVGDGLTVSLDADGSEIFQGTVDIFDALSDLKAALDANDTNAIANQQAVLDSAITQIQEVRTKNAAFSSHLEATATHISGLQGTVKDLLSSTEDADLEAAIIDFKAQETAYEASLAVSAQIIQKSLVDFL